MQGDSSSHGSSGEQEDTHLAKTEKFQPGLQTLREGEEGDEDEHNEIDDPDGAKTLRDAEFREEKKNACIWSAPNPQTVRHRYLAHRKQRPPRTLQ